MEARAVRKERTEQQHRIKASNRMGEGGGGGKGGRSRITEHRQSRGDRT